MWCPCRSWFGLSGCLWKHTAEDVYEVVQSWQVAVLPVALHPGSPVVKGLRGGQRDRLPKVDHPHSGLPWGIVHKQQRTADNLLWEKKKGETCKFKAWEWGNTGAEIRSEILNLANRFVSVCLTSCVLKKCDCSRTDRSSSSRCR